MTIVSHASKLFGKHFRALLMPFIAQITAGTQYGEGMHGGETGLERLFLTQSIELIRSSQMCAITLFTDIIGAYA